MGFLHSNRDIQSFGNNFDFSGREFTTKGDRERLILNSLNELMNNKIDLDRRASRIRSMATPIMRSNNEYRRLLLCCPTQDEMIWNF
jgi:hypothetical protein